MSQFSVRTFSQKLVKLCCKVSADRDVGKHAIQLSCVLKATQVLSTHTQQLYANQNPAKLSHITQKELGQISKYDLVKFKY